MNQTSIVPYLTFNGNCREAMTFYHECLGGEINIMGFDQAPGMPPDAKGVMHSNIKFDNFVLMASDTTPEHPVTNGTSVALSVNCTSKAQVDKFFHALAAGGKVTMGLEDTFWGAYFGMLTDKFGMNWMFNYDDPAKVQPH